MQFIHTCSHGARVQFNSHSSNHVTATAYSMQQSLAVLTQQSSTAFEPRSSVMAERADVLNKKGDSSWAIQPLPVQYTH